MASIPATETIQLIRTLGVRTALTVLTLSSGALLTLAFVTGAASGAQDPVDSIETTILIATRLDALPATSITLSAVAVTLAPGAATKPFVNAGPSLMTVEQGDVTLVRNQSERSPTPSDAMEASLPPTSNLGTGDQITIPAGIWVQLHATDAAAVRLFFVVLAPHPAPTT